MTKARENSDYTGLAADIVAGDTAARAGRKNLIINGGFDVWQRGDYTSATNSVSDAYLADRWKTWLGNVTATTQNTSVTINGKTKSAFKIEATNSATGYMGLLQVIEDKNFPKNEDVIASAWVRTNNINTRFRETGFSGSGSNGPTFNSDGGWHKVTWNIGTKTTPSTGHMVIGIIIFGSSSVSISSGDYIEIADFQLELGSVATDFEHRSYGEELALCQRYYQVDDNAYGNSGKSYSMASLDMPVTITRTHSVTMRASPTVVFTSNNRDSSNNVITANINASVADSWWYGYRKGGGSSLEVAVQVSNLSFDAEL